VKEKLDFCFKSHNMQPEINALDYHPSFMSSPGDEEEDAAWFRPVWETDDEPTPPGRVPSRAGRYVPPDYTHPLLSPLAQAQDAVARLEARLDVADDAVASGLRARAAYREAAGLLAFSHVWIHPRDLALRDANLTGSYFAALRDNRLGAELPSTSAHGHDFDVAPSDILVNRALRLAGRWRRLAEIQSWKPIADCVALRETLDGIASKPLRDGECDEWMAGDFMREQGPALIRAGHGAREWMNRGPAVESLPADGIFLAACLWRQSGFGRSIALPFWLAPEAHLNRLAPRIGLDWMTSFLGCVAHAAKVVLADLLRLQDSAAKGRRLSFTARSKMPAAIELLVREPVMTAAGLARRLDITHQAAIALLRQLVEAGLVQEATGRAAWRVFVLA
jgi:HTH DNA binding domain